MITIRKSLGGIAAVLFALAMGGCTAFDHVAGDAAKQPTQDLPGA